MCFYHLLLQCFTLEFINHILSIVKDFNELPKPDGDLLVMKLLLEFPAKFDEVSARSDWCHQVLTFDKEKVVST